MDFNKSKDETAKEVPEIHLHFLSQEQLQNLLKIGMTPDVYICSEGHIHGEPNTMYSVQIKARHPARPDTIMGIVSFDMTTDEDGNTPPLAMCFGDGLEGLELRRCLVHGDETVWEGKWINKDGTPYKTFAEARKQ